MSFGDLSASIIVACYNERRSVGLFLKSLTSQSVPGGSIEAIIADAMSTDGSRAVLEEYAARHPWIRIVDNSRRIASAGLNTALRETRADIILRMDVHTEYAPDYVSQCLALLKEAGAANVGGPARTAAHGYWQTAAAVAFNSAFFCGGARFHNQNYEGPVDTVPYGCWRRATLEALGGFDERFVRNQDDELNFRIHEAGGTVWQSPRIHSWYYPRPSLKGLAGQYFEYGLWKAVVIRKHGRPAACRHVVPSSALVVLLALAIGGVFNSVFWYAELYGLALYWVASLIASVRALEDAHQLPLLPALPLVFGTAHISYAVGVLKGWISPPIRLAKPRAAVRVFPDDI